MAEILTPDRVKLYRNMPESAQDLCGNLIATIDALAKALKAVLLWGEAYMDVDLFEGDKEEKKYARRLVRRADEAQKVLKEVAGWLPDDTRWNRIP